MGKKKKPTATKQPPKKKPSVGEAKSWDDLIESPGCSNVLGEHRAVSKIEGGGSWEQRPAQIAPHVGSGRRWDRKRPSVRWETSGRAALGARVGHRIPGGSGVGAAVINGEGERRSVGESIVRSQVE